MRDATQPKLPFSIFAGVFITLVSGCSSARPDGGTDEIAAGTPAVAQPTAGSAAGAPSVDESRSDAGAAGGGGKEPTLPAAGAGGMGPNLSAGKQAPPAEPAPEVVTEPSDDAAYLFDQTHVRTYNIVVAPADLAMIDQHPAAEEWVPAQLEFEGKTYGPIKMRYKGSEGSFKAPCTQDGPDDAKAGKCSIKLGFDEVDENLRFYGLKKLNFHAMNNDRSLLRDRLGYSLYRDSQVAAPRAAHAKLLVNGELEGLFVAVEQVDGRFTRARFSEGGEGNVYKEVWVSNKDEQAFVAALEANTDMPDVTGMLAFQAAVNTSAAATEPFIDRTYMARYLAVDRVIVSDDGALHFYCDPDSGPSYAVGNGNYYWYQAAQARRFWLIPWDLDLAFDGTPWVTIQPEWSADAACTCVAPPTGFAAQLPPSCDALVEHFVSWHDDYERAVDSFIAGPFSDARVQAKLKAWTEQIEPFVMESAKARGGLQVDDWAYAVDELGAKITAQRAHRGYAY